jgi:Tfp pilus assembly protein PilO
VRILRGRRRLDLREDFWTIAGACGVLLLLNLGFYMLVNLPRVRVLADLAEGQNRVRGALKTAEERVGTMRELMRRYDEEVVRLEDFYANRLGTQLERMTAVQKEIRTIASEFRIDPNSIDYHREDVGKTDLVRFQMSVPLEGGYPNLRQFISRIESSRHLLTVDSVELTGSQGGGAMLSLTIRISTYFRAPERGEPPPAAPGPRT